MGVEGRMSQGLSQNREGYLTPGAPFPHTNSEPQGQSRPTVVDVTRPGDTHAQNPMLLRGAALAVQTALGHRGGDSRDLST